MLGSPGFIFDVPHPPESSEVRVNFVARAVAISFGFTLLVSPLAPSARAIGGDQFLALCSISTDKSDHDFCLGYVFAIAVGSVTDNSLNFLRSLSADATGTTNGTITLVTGISVDNNALAANTGSVTIAGDVTFASSYTIDTNQDVASSSGGGSVDLSNATISANTTNVDLIINTAASGAVDMGDADGGSVSLGTLNGDAGNFINDFSVITSGFDDTNDGQAIAIAGGEVM